MSKKIDGTAKIIKSINKELDSGFYSEERIGDREDAMSRIIDNARNGSSGIINEYFSEDGLINMAEILSENELAHYVRILIMDLIDEKEKDKPKSIQEIIDDNLTIFGFKDDDIRATLFDKSFKFIKDSIDKNRNIKMANGLTGDKMKIKFDLNITSVYTIIDSYNKNIINLLVARFLTDEMRQN